MRTTTDVDPHLLADAKHGAALHDRSLSDVINDTLRVAFADTLEQRTRARIQLPVDGGSGLMPGVGLEDRHAVLDLLDEQ